MVETVKAVGAAVATLIVAAITVWWLFEVARRLGVPPTVNAQGAVVLDAFQRAKDILALVLPLFTAALAYWVGNRGASQAEEKADAATKQLDAVLDASPMGVLKKAQDEHPEAFAK